MLKNLFCSFRIILLILIAVVASTAQPGTKLRYAFAAGQKISIVQTESTQDSDENFVDHTKKNTSGSKEINQSWEVKSVSPSGDAVIGVQYTSLRTTTSPAPGFNIVVSTAQTIKEANPLLVQYGEQAAPVIEKLETLRKIFVDLFIPRTFTIVVSSTGAVKSVTGFEEAMDNYRLQIEKIVPDKQKRAEIDALIEAFFGEDAVNKTFSYTLFTPLPGENVTLGNQWTDSTEFSINSIHMPIKRNFRLATVTGPAFTLDETINFGVPSSTEEIEFKLLAGTIKTQIALDPTKTNIQLQDYDGILQIEAYPRVSENRALILRVSSTFHGTVRMTRVQ